MRWPHVAVCYLSRGSSNGLLSLDCLLNSDEMIKKTGFLFVPPQKKNQKNKTKLEPEGGNSLPVKAKRRKLQQSPVLLPGVFQTSKASIFSYQTNTKP